MQIKSEIKEKIVLALDVDTVESAKVLVSELKDYVGIFKVGLQLCSVNNNSELFDFMKEQGVKFFYDAKLMDSPNAVARASENIVKTGAGAYSMHIMGGREMLSRSAKAAREKALEMGTADPMILGVTVLTNINDEILNNQLKVPYKTTDYALDLALLAKESGLDGVVASVWEARRIKQACGSDFKVLCPSIKPTWSVDGSAKKLATPKLAIKEGADYLVVGRSVTAAKNRVEAIQKVYEEIENAMLTQGESSAVSKARLLLANGMIFEGEAIGAQGTAFGEIVFNTSMTGYQEILTDPSYAEQVIVMTYPEIGNYGINKDDFESGRVYAKGFIVKNCCEDDSHYKSVQTISDYLKQNNIIAISKIDTRALTKIIRENGDMNCVVTTQEITSELKNQLSEFKISKDITLDVSTYRTLNVHGTGVKLAIIDLGIKKSIVECLKEYNCNITIYPADVEAKVILDEGFDALLISNGPGNPQDAVKTIETAKQLVGRLPMFGICLGHQILSIVLGAKTYKLKYGHRGGNHPVINLETNKVIITSQNHGYAVVEDDMHEAITVTYKNLNDGTIEGMKCERLSVESVQFHPEAAPGPHDANIVFDEWIKKIEKMKEAELCQRI